jgi:hypothetical protein
MQMYSVWHARAESRRNGKVDHRWVNVAQLVDGESRVMRDDCARLASAVVAAQGEHGKVFALLWREGAKPIDASSYSDPVARCGVVLLLLVRIAGVCCLFRREVSLLGTRNFSKSIVCISIAHGA